MMKVLWMVMIIFLMISFNQGDALSQVAAGGADRYYQGITVAASYSYHLSGRTDRVKGYLIKIEDLKTLSNPGLVFLVSDLEEGEGFVEINGSRYPLPGLMGQLSTPAEKSEKNVEGKEGWYSYSSGDDIIGKIILPIAPGILQNGLNEATFYRTDQGNGFEIIDARLQRVSQNEPTLIGQTYHLLARGKPSSISDFDYVFQYQGEKKRPEKDIPQWARRGKVNFYRAGIDWDHLDRMFEMFKEARINLVATQVPRDKTSAEFQRVKAFIDRCHQQGIKVTAFNSMGNISLREALMNPDVKKWISQDEYGDYRWREKGGTYAADLQNVDYRQNELLIRAEAQLDAGADELYYDWAIGGTGDILDFFSEVRQLAESKGKNVSIYGNCKGNILADESCDLTKTEGTTEAGVWEGEWIHNIPQARFYYASGDGVKPYRSKYEGADPGVPNPGAKDVREGMKVGWKRPIAEASAFQSHFVIAEAGEKLLQGWIKKDNPLAMQVWDDICRYYVFLDDHQNLYTDVHTISHIAVLSPPQIPSFEVALKRDNLYNALAEHNIMYEVALLPRITNEMLKHYRLLIIPHIPWVDDHQLSVIRNFKKQGGKIYTIGSTAELQELADIFSPASLIWQLTDEPGVGELLQNVQKLAGEPMVIVPDTRYVAANLTMKNGKNQAILHLVNYAQPLQDVKVFLNLEGFVSKIDKKKIRLVSPDGVPGEIKNISLKNGRLEFTIPRLEVYNVLTIN